MTKQEAINKVIEDQYLVLSLDAGDDVIGLPDRWLMASSPMDLVTATKEYNELKETVSNVYLVKLVAYQEYI